jgi:hypothetical protein
MSQVSPVFRLQDAGGGRRVEVRESPLQLQGDPELCRRVAEYLDGPVTSLGGSLDQESGERGTKVVTISPGEPGWLVGCLRRASREMGLRLTELGARD